MIEIFVAAAIDFDYAGGDAFNPSNGVASPPPASMPKKDEGNGKDDKNNNSDKDKNDNNANNGNNDNGNNGKYSKKSQKKNGKN